MANYVCMCVESDIKENESRISVNNIENGGKIS